MRTSSRILLVVGGALGAAVGMVATIDVVACLIRVLAQSEDVDTLWTRWTRLVHEFVGRLRRKKRKLEYVGRVTSLCLYPIKACNGVYITDAYIGRDGLRLHRSSPIRDRHWGILEIPTDHIVHMKYEQTFIRLTPRFVDDRGETLTGGFEDAGDLCLVLDAPGCSSLALPVPPVALGDVVEGVDVSRMKTTIPTLARKSMTKTPALYTGEKLDAWLNEFLGCADNPKYRLMVKPAEYALRQISGEMSAVPFLEKAKKSDEVAFHAVAPLQVMNESSVDDLNERILRHQEAKNGGPLDTTAKKVDVINFRANIILKTDVPYDEDSWAEMWIAPSSNADLKSGDLVKEADVVDFVLMRRLAPCQRCTITTVDPESGQFRKDNEPLVTLMRYRRCDGWGTNPVLGTYTGVDRPGPVRVGDAVYVTRDAGLPKPSPKRVAIFEKFWGRKF